MGWIKDALARHDTLNLMGGQDYLEDKMMEKMRKEFSPSNQPMMGQATAQDYQRLYGGSGQMPTAMGVQGPSQAPQQASMDFSGASGNPFASKAQSMGFSDFNNAGLQRNMANALRSRGGAFRG